MSQAVDLILLRAKVKDPSMNLLQMATALKQMQKNEFSQTVITYSNEANYLYGYFYLEEAIALGPIDKNTFFGNLANHLDDVEISRIVFENPITGFSSDQVPHNRYAVEMDPEPGWKEELFAWYDLEHLPGLASVPGCVKATRCINLDHAPYSFAFYDLLSQEVLGCEAWLKVRHTAWSDKVRPHFTNTRRTMFSFL